MQNERFLNLLKTKINKPMSPTLNLLALAVFQLLPLSVSATAATPTKDTRPNIIFILCDDLGYGDLAVNGHPYVKSPNIDRLAAEGLTIQNAYTSAAWCAPSRYALMSGRYPAHYFQKSLRMDAAAPNLYHTLKSVGYTTAHFGKWHMSGEGADVPTAADYGVDEDFIHNGKDEGWTKEERDQPHWRENTTQRYVNLAIDFIEKQTATESPFYLNLWVYPTHSYIDPRADMLEPYRDLQVDIQDFENPLMRDFLTWISTQGDLEAAMRAYCSDVTELDNQIGRLLKALQDLGIDENTLIVFSSDNGPPPLGGVHNRDQLAERIQARPTLINCVGSSGPFRDRKISLHDGGTRVPFFVRWPGKVPSGKIDFETIFTGVDLLPTLASLVGADIPKNIDGENLVAALAGQSTKRAGPHYWNDRPGWTTLRDNQWKAHLQKGKVRLFNILEDPSESNDLSQRLPERASHYLALLKAWEAEVLSQ